MTTLLRTLAGGVAALRQASELRTDYAEAHHDLTVALSTTARNDDAVRHAVKAADIAMGGPLVTKMRASHQGRMNR